MPLLVGASILFEQKTGMTKLGDSDQRDAEPCLYELLMSEPQFFRTS
jgi:hypothetical protein